MATIIISCIVTMHVTLQLPCNQNHKYQAPSLSVAILAPAGCRLHLAPFAPGRGAVCAWPPFAPGVIVPMEGLDGDAEDLRWWASIGSAGAANTRVEITAERTTKQWAACCCVTACGT